LVSTGYARSLRLLDRELEWLTSADRAAIFGTTAMRLYWPEEGTALLVD
jgi:hypothetical protein